MEKYLFHPKSLGQSWWNSGELLWELGGSWMSPAVHRAAAGQEGVCGLRATHRNSTHLLHSQDLPQNPSPVEAEPCPQPKPGEQQRASVGLNGAFVLLGVSPTRADTLAFQSGYTLFLHIFCVLSSPLSFTLNLTFLLHLTGER